MSPSLWLPRAWHARSPAAPRVVRRIKAGARALRTVSARRHQLIAAARSGSHLPAFRRCVDHDMGAPAWSTTDTRLRATSDDVLTGRVPGAYRASCCREPRLPRRLAKVTCAPHDREQCGPTE